MAILVAALGVAIPVAANLPGSTFEAEDGNLVVNGSETDWATPAPDLKIKADAEQTNSDDSYKGGEKHDDVCPASSTGSIPPTKDDLTRLYVGDETVGSDVFLYMAWERFLSKDSSASAHMGFEFNKTRTACGGASKNVQRSPGDVLILYDLEGGGKPAFELLRWLTPAKPRNGVCKVAAGPPCWGDVKTLDGTQAEGEVNRDAPITDPLLAPGQTQARTLGFKHMFGEAAVNLTAAGVFEPGVCDGFGSALLASRSSGNSFQSTLKDFVGPLDIDISNCGDIKVIKKDDTGRALEGATFGLFKDNDPKATGGQTAPGTEDVGTQQVPIAPVATCTTGDDGTCLFDNVQIGDYWLVETVTPSGHQTAAPKPVSLDTAGSTEEVEFINQRDKGDVRVVKRDDGQTLMSGVTFTLKGTSDFGDAVDLSCTTSAIPGPDFGTCTFSDVPLGTYTLDEDASTLPAGYSKDPTLPKQVTIDEDGELVTVNVTNPRKHTVITIVCHEGDTPSLFAVDVRNGTSTKKSIDAVPAALAAKQVTQGDLCAIGGARFAGLGHTDKALTVELSDGH